MLSVGRGLIGPSRSGYSGAIASRRTAISAKKCTNFSNPSSWGKNVQKRQYARWSKIVSRMSPESLAKMRENASKNNRQGHTNYTVKTSNTVGDPWLAPRLGNPFAAKFWTDSLDWAKHVFMSYIASPWRVRNVSNQLKLQRITRGQIRTATLETYVKYNQTLSTFHISSMASYVSDSVMNELRSKFGKTVLPAGSKPIWEHQNLKSRILNFVIVQVPAPLNMHIVQVTVRITGNQKFVVFDHSGKVILGKDEFRPVEDTWVLEKIIEKPEYPWVVLATHLDHPDDVAAAKAAQESK